MNRILKTEPVRLYSIGMAAVALAAYFLPSGAWPLVLALLAAVLGVGEGVRTQVWSQDSHERVIDHLTTLAAVLPPPDTEPTTGAPKLPRKKRRS